MPTTKNQPSTELAIPELGEVVNLADPDSCALAYERLDGIAKQIGVWRGMLRAELVRHASEYGANTMRTERAEVTVGTSSEILWDLEVLRELRAAGLPDERWDALVEVTVGHKVKASVANQIEKANPAYAEIVGRARSRHPKPPTVAVALRMTP